MMFQITPLCAAILLLTPSTLARPLRPERRAGGPVASPIDNCTITSVYPSFDGWGLGYNPSPEFVSDSLLYSYILNEPYQLQSSEQILFRDCLAACHGYGNPGECKSVFVAYSFPSPIEGKTLGTAAPAENQFGCVMFSEVFTPDDLVAPVTEGTYISAKSAGITCPA